MNGSFDWPAVLDVGAGLGVLIAGIGIFVGMRALAKTLARVNVTLDEVDRQLDGMGRPLAQVLGHVGGIADTADQTLARLTGVVQSLESVAGSIAQTAQLTKDSISPAIINAGATISGISAGLKRMFNGRKDDSDKGTTSE